MSRSDFARGSCAGSAAEQLRGAYAGSGRSRDRSRSIPVLGTTNKPSTNAGELLYGAHTQADENTMGLSAATGTAGSGVQLEFKREGENTTDGSLKHTYSGVSIGVISNEHGSVRPIGTVGVLDFSHSMSIVGVGAQVAAQGKLSDKAGVDYKVAPNLGVGVSAEVSDLTYAKDIASNAQPCGNPPAVLVIAWPTPVTGDW